MNGTEAQRVRRSTLLRLGLRCLWLALVGFPKPPRIGLRWTGEMTTNGARLLISGDRCTVLRPHPPRFDDVR